MIFPLYGWMNKYVYVHIDDPKYVVWCNQTCVISKGAHIIYPLQIVWLYNFKNKVDAIVFFVVISQFFTHKEIFTINDEIAGGDSAAMKL